MFASVLRRHWYLVLVVTLVCIGAGLAVASAQSRTYDAQVVLQVGRLDIQSQAVPGFVTGAQSLASSYSRVAASEIIARAVARRLRLSPEQVRKDLDATPIPDSPTLKILGSGSTASEARSVARAGAAELRRFVTRLTRTNESHSALLTTFRLYTGSAERLRAQAKALALADRQAGLKRESAQTVATRVAAATAQLRADSAAELFRNAQTNQSGSADLSILDPGSGATDDHKQLLERYAFVGLVGGLVLGMGFALLLARRRRTR